MLFWFNLTLLLYTGRKWIYEITTWSLGHNKKPVSDQKLMGELGCWCFEKKKKRILKKEEGVEIGFDVAIFNPSDFMPAMCLASI